jgi:uncharacterized protein (TIGR03086 family)
MSPDLRPGPDSPPTDELASAEATLGVLQQVLHTIARDDSVERQVIGAARPTLDAWHRRGLQGNVQLGPNEMPAKVAAGVLSVEFLVHAWDYAVTVGRDVKAPDSVAEYVLGLAREPR